MKQSKNRIVGNKKIMVKINRPEPASVTKWKFLSSQEGPLVPPLNGEWTPRRGVPTKHALQYGSRECSRRAVPAGKTRWQRPVAPCWGSAGGALIGL